MFVGRQRELDLLRQRVKGNTFEFGLVYGRRRIGKTTLLKKLIEQTPGIYFVASEMDLAYNIRKLSQTVTGHFGDRFVFSTLEDIFAYLQDKSRQRRVLLIIDEFTYLFSKEPGVQSVLQGIIDDLVSYDIALVLSGSQVGMIEDVISYRKPLYGRTTFKIKLEPFDYYDSARFYPGYPVEDKIRTYAVFGGIPYVLSKIDERLSLAENIIRLIVDKDGILGEETEFFLKRELRATSTYGMIIHAIAGGATRLSEISDKSLVHNTGTTSKYIKTLMDLGIVRKDICFSERESSRKTLYRISDHFFDFHDRFIHSNRSKQALMSSGAFYDTVIKPELDQYVSRVYEDVCKEYLIRKSRRQPVGQITEIARYWANHTGLKREIEIDLATKDSMGVTVYECKWTNRPFDASDAKNLINESTVLSPYRHGGFSKSGFTDEALRHLDIALTPESLFDPSLA